MDRETGIKEILKRIKKNEVILGEMSEISATGYRHASIFGRVLQKHIQ